MTYLYGLETKRYDEAYELAKQGDFESIPKDILIRCYRSLKSIHSDQKKTIESLTPGVKHFWFHGSTGTGKSMKAREIFSPFYLKNASNKWWDGYNGEDNVIIDDFDKKFEYNGYYLKIWGDMYGFVGEVKNGNTGLIRPRNIVVTSNFHPEEIWQDKQTLEPLLRRFQVICFPVSYDILKN